MVPYLERVVEREALNGLLQGGTGGIHLSLQPGTFAAQVIQMGFLIVQLLSVALDQRLFIGAIGQGFEVFSNALLIVVDLVSFFFTRVALRFQGFYSTALVEDAAQSFLNCRSDRSFLDEQRNLVPVDL